MSETKILGVPKESLAGERRVALIPDTVKRLIKLGYQVWVQSGAGVDASFSDESYEQSGAKIVEESTVVWSGVDAVLKINPPTPSEVSLMRQGGMLISLLMPAQNKELLSLLAERRITAIGLDAVPRISRAQKMDVLSSMANIAGYRAVIEAANHFGRFFTGQITAAGKVAPAKVLVIGAGVAGLSAIGTAKGLGAIVRAFDTRPAVKDQVKSMGGEFLELDFQEDGTGTGGYAKEMSPEFIKAEMELFAKQAKDVDIIITTALIPGREAPELILEEHLKLMRPGSVLVDLAAAQGGNCKLTENGKVVVKYGVTLIGYSDLPSRLPTQSSQLFGNNLFHLISEMSKSGLLHVNKEDEAIRGALVAHEGEVTWPPPPLKISQDATPLRAVKADEKAKEEIGPPKKIKLGDFVMIIGAVILALIGGTAPGTFLQHFSIFILAIVIGWQVVWNVSHALHTPLMSVTNAISGIIIIGALAQFDGELGGLAMTLAILATILASINVAGGFYVTQRMLKMFRK
jgi:NAD(P) transhydrogenase subunit alpha